MIAFWKYDLFPYCLWGTVEKTEGNKVFIKEYGNWFSNPLAVVDDETGKQQIAELQKLVKERRERLEYLNSEFSGRLWQITKGWQ